MVNDMKPTKLDDYRFNPKRVAKGMWGDDCSAIKTTRPRASFYDCAGHGGYVVDPRVLTNEEKKNINKDIKPEKLYLCVQHREDGDYVMATDYRHVITSWEVGKAPRSPTCRVDRSLGSVEWIEFPVYVFEEDVDYSILEHHTDITLKEFEHDPIQKKKTEETYKNWIDDKR